MKSRPAVNNTPQKCYVCNRKSFAIVSYFRLSIVFIETYKDKALLFLLQWDHDSRGLILNPSQSGVYHLFQTHILGFRLHGWLTMSGCPRVKSGKFGQSAKFGQRPCLIYISNIGIKNKLTKQTVIILMRRLIRSRLIWIYTVYICVSEFTWCQNLSDFTPSYKQKTKTEIQYNST